MRTKYLRVVAGVLSLFLSGLGSLMAQTVIQRYISTVFGGMDTVIMALVSFSFIAGIGAGTLVAGRLSRLKLQPNHLWAGVELACAAAVAAYLTLFSSVHHAILPHLLGISSEHIYLVYYVYILLLQFGSSFLLATIMGMNYPLAFQTLASGKAGASNRLAMLLIAANTLGAAVGSFATPRLMMSSDLFAMTRLAAVMYVFSGLLVLPLRRLETVNDPEAEAESSESAPEKLRHAYLLLFLGGAAGFSFEVVVFRHFALINAGDHKVFGTALGVFLVCWSLGTMLAPWKRVALVTVTGLFAATLLLSSIMVSMSPIFQHVAFRAADPASYAALLAFFLPALCSGWYFSKVHLDAGQLNTRHIAALYFANLCGSFVGGVITKYVLPNWISFTYSLLLWSFVLGLSVWLIRPPTRRWIAVMATGYAVVFGICLLVRPLHCAYYKNFNYPTEQLVEVKEDWATTAWLTTEGFYVGNRPQKSFPEDPLYGHGLFEAVLPMRLHRHSNIFIAGAGLGSANGAVAHFFPNSRVVCVDYSPAVHYFVGKYGKWNFDLLRQPNVMYHTTDARLQLSVEKQPFDVIMEFAEHEGVPGISTIKSVEFLRLVKKKLTPGGVYVGLGSSEECLATIQQVFKNVYKERKKPYIIATDAELEELLDPAVLKEWAEKDERLKQGLIDAKNATDFIKMTPVRARIIRDSDPCADYGPSHLIPFDPRHFATCPIIRFGPLRSPN